MERLESAGDGSSSNKRTHRLDSGLINLDVTEYPNPDADDTVVSSPLHDGIDELQDGTLADTDTASECPDPKNCIPTSPA